MPLISHDAQARAARANEKARQVLGFLRGELWTTAAVCQKLLKLETLSATHRSLRSLQRRGLIELDKVQAARPLVIAGITAAGQAWIADALDQSYLPRRYEPGRVSAATLLHREALQHLRIAAARKGWTGWVYPDRQPPANKARQPHRPDAIATTPANVRVAIEVERTIKTHKRYRFVVGAHLDAIARGDYARVIYVAPSPSIRKALEVIFAGLGHAVVAGRDMRLDADALGKFEFVDLGSFSELRGEEK